MITYIETIKDAIYEVRIKPGQIIYATDTNETFFDTEEGNRIILNDVIYLNKESEKLLIMRPLTNRIYIVKETSQPYRYDGAWFKIKDPDYLLCTVFHKDNYVPTTIMKGDKKIAPRTLASIVYNDRGEDVLTEIDRTRKLTLCKTKAVYVEATENGQKVFRIPFPILDYDFRKNFMTVIINGLVVEENNYTIRDDHYFVLNDDQTPLDSGQLVLFIFYYNVFIDINDGVLLQTKNLADRCVTEPKLASNAVSNRTIIDKAIGNAKLADNSIDSRVLGNNVVSESNLANNSVSSRTIVEKAVTNQKLGDNAVDHRVLSDNAVRETNLADNSVRTRIIGPRAVINEKLEDNSVDGRVIAPNSINTIHLDTRDLSISANNIRETEEKRFISREEKYKLDDAVQYIECLKRKPEIHVSSSEPTENVKETDIWVDLSEFIFKVRTGETWTPMGAVYK